MKIEIADVSGIPEALKALVSDQDGKSVLDLTQVMPVQDLSGLKGALQKERENKEVYAKFGTPDEIQARFDELEAKAAKGGKGGEEAQAKLDAMREEYEGKLSDRDARLTKMMRSNTTASLKTELAKANFIPEAIDDIAASAMGRIEFADDGTPKVMTSDGKPMIGNGADHGATLADLAAELAASKPYAVRDAGKGGGGKPPHDGGKPAKKWGEMTGTEKVKLHRENPQEYERLKTAG